MRSVWNPGLTEIHRLSTATACVGILITSGGRNIYAIP
jgi:hypothetical protein